MKKPRSLLLLVLPFLIAMLSACEKTIINNDVASTASSTPMITVETVNTETPVINQPLEITTQPINTQSSWFDFSQNLEVMPISGSYQFTEGPIATSDGGVYFSDVNAGRIYKWNLDGRVNLFVEGLNAPNGLALDNSGNLIVCEGGNRRLISISMQGLVTVVADQYNGIRFNEPNDLWIDPQGGIYFTDPAYNSAVVQKGEDVYYVTPDRSQVIRVIDNLVKPNGIVGTADGSKLYVADWGAGAIYSYAINPVGTLANSQLFVKSGSDGMTLDQSGNVYLTTANLIKIYDPYGNLVKEIPTIENPTNLELAGKDESTLFITARTAVYTMPLLKTEHAATNDSDSSGFILTSPDIAEGGVLPTEYTCDGASSTLALSWSGAPEGTKSYAVLMDHIASPTDIHWYWILYKIPVEVTSLAKNSTGIGVLGTNSVNDKLEYSPPCSKGPGFKTYTYTVYALSAELQFSVSPDKVNREIFLAAVQGITLANAKLNVTYARP